jgi:hypothetical protein
MAPLPDHKQVLIIERDRISFSLNVIRSNWLVLKDVLPLIVLFKFFLIHILVSHVYLAHRFIYHQDLRQERFFFNHDLLIRRFFLNDDNRVGVVLSNIRDTNSFLFWLLLLVNFGAFFRFFGFIFPQYLDMNFDGGVILVHFEVGFKSFITLQLFSLPLKCFE